VEQDEQDRPPAGTECVTCRARGHYCPAKFYLGATDVALCQPCKDGEDCPTFQQLKKPETLAWDPEDSVDTVTEQEEPTAEPVRQQARHIGRLGSGISEEKKQAILAAPQEESDSKVGRRLGIRQPTVSKIRRAAGIPPAKPSYHGRKHGDVYKHQERDIAATALQEGHSIREAAAMAGVSKNTVLEVKKTLPNVPARANNGGAPTHKGKPDGLWVPPNAFEIALEAARQEIIEIHQRVSELAEREEQLEQLAESLKAMLAAKP
jgi:transposase